MPGNYYLRVVSLQVVQIFNPLPPLFCSNLTGKRMGSIEKNIASVQGFYGRNPDRCIVLLVTHNFRDYFQAMPFQFKVVFF